jgi:hypothetical protein
MEVIVVQKRLLMACDQVNKLQRQGAVGTVKFQQIEIGRGKPSGEAPLVRHAGRVANTPPHNLSCYRLPWYTICGVREAAARKCISQAPVPPRKIFKDVKSAGK